MRSSSSKRQFTTRRRRAYRSVCGLTEALEQRMLLSVAAPIAGDSGVFDGHTYRVIVPGSLTSWTDAQAAAQAAGGHLVTINSPGEQAFLEGLLAAADVPTGAYSIGGRVTSTSPLTYGWATGEPLSYTHWDPTGNEPNSGGAEPVMAMLWTRTPGERMYFRRGFWNDEIERGYTPSEQPVFTDLPRRGYIVEVESADQTYQAEQAAVSGAMVSAAHGGFTGSGYVDYVNASGDAVEFTVQVPSAARYELSFRYANGALADRLMELELNGTAVMGGINFARTGSWSAWRDATASVALAAGSNKIRLLANAQSGPNLDSLTVRPVAPPPAVTYQAESATLVGPRSLSNLPGFTGTGFADYQHARGDFTEFAIDVPADGAYSLDFRYANGSASDRPLELRVDAAVVTVRLSFGSTGTWSTWNDVTQPVALTAGRHVVRLTAIGSNGPNLDALTVTAAPTPPPPEPVTIQAEQSAMSGVLVAKNHTGFTGSAFADYQLDTGAFVDFTCDVLAGGDYTLEFRYANGGMSDRPLELKVNGAVAQPRLSFAPTGSWNQWGNATATVALLAGRNTIRLTAIGSNGPNLDALTVRPAQPSQTEVIYLSQARSISGGLREEFTVINPDTGEEETLREDGGDSRSAPDFGDFDGVIAGRVTPPPGWESGLVAGSQHSRLTDAGIFVSGDLNGHTATDRGGYGIDSDVDVTFEVDQPRNYLLTYSITADTSAIPRRSISLTKVGGAAVFEEVPPLTNNTVTGTRAGTLAAGQYRFVFHHSIGGDVGSQGPYSLELALNR